MKDEGTPADDPEQRQKEPVSSLRFLHLATPDKNAGVKHFIGIAPDGQAQSWGKNNFGQLGRQSSTTVTKKSKSSTSSKHQPLLVECEDHLNRNSNQESSNATSSTAANTNSVVFVKAYVGGASDSGHSALLDADGHLWLAGCDRWQQLGLGSSAGGSAGYTWNQGRIWRNQFVKNDFLINGNDVGGIRDVALGGDHTVILSKNQRDVFVFGKGGDGQLGVDGNPFVSAPTRSKVLSVSQTAASTATATDSTKIAAVCAIQHCSLTLDEHGSVMNQAGKCRNIQKSLEFCVRRAHRDGLLQINAKK